MIAPRDQFAARIDPALQEMKACRTIEVVRHVVFARPQKLHRHANLFGDRRGLDDIVVTQASAESAAGAQQMNLDITRGDA